MTADDLREKVARERDLSAEPSRDMHEPSRQSAAEGGWMRLETAIGIAVRAHRGQTDKGGAPYILHPLRVMLAMQTDEERIVAVLHDVVEDCPAWPLNRLGVNGAGEAFLGALDALTRRDGESYSDFIERIALSPLATKVKLADLADNADLSRIAAPTAADYKRREKYEVARLRLLSAPGEGSQAPPTTPTDPSGQTRDGSP